MTTSDKIKDLSVKTEKILAHGGEKAVKKQHALGKLTARRRIARLLDEDSFVETDRFVTHRCAEFGMAEKEIVADGAVCGYGKIDGRTVFVFAQDFTSQGGTMSEMNAKKICKIMDMAKSVGAPVIGLNDSGGARIQEGVDSLSGYGQIFYRNSLCSGIIPQISVIMGPCAGGASYSPALTDFVIMVDRISQMFITGPAVVESTTGEVISAEELGGAYTHASTSGVAHLVAESEDEALEFARKILSYLPSSADELPPVRDYAPGDELREALDEIIPDNDRFPYDMKDVIEQIVDEGSFFELQPLFADNIITGFARVAGRSVGIIANQPYSLGGCLDINASDKAARFIQMCDSFNVPLLNLVDVPGFLPGVDQEHAGIIRHGAKMLYTYSVAEVPKITVILRKAYGGSYLAMCSKDLGADCVLAWPTAAIAVMGAEGATSIIFRKEIEAAEDKQAKREEMIELYGSRFANPYIAASRGYVDMVIKPSETRKQIISALEVLETKERQGRVRGNMPL
ncbi:MAG TPA: acyl-CoA carboxylase subunit beta [Clostridiales bacterium]|nr:acyl-CoA carboxylase subunit beta [Clostridiales bacterium]